MHAVREREGYDRWLLTTVVVLLCLGVVIVLDASCARANQALNNPFYYFQKQAMWACIAGVAMTVGMYVPYWHLRRFWLLGVAVSTVLLILVLIPHVGIEVNGSRRWLGLRMFNFQPSEFAKLAVVLFLARYSELWRGRVQHFSKGFLPAVGVVFLLGGLVAKEDLGTGITIISTGLVMIYMMGARGQHMALLLVMALLGGVFAILKEPYRMDRISAWLMLATKPMEVHSGPAYQPAQGLIALGSGGVTGQGIMQGYAKHLYLPAEHTDYIFATVGEETGLLGCLLLLLLFGILIVKGLTISHRTRDWFGSLVAAGMTTLVGVQALLNMAVVTGIVPCTGVPLPFISYGGSSVVFTSLAVGILLNISQYPNRGAAGSGAGSAEKKARPGRESHPDGWRNRRPHLSGT